MDFAAVLGHLVLVLMFHRYDVPLVADIHFQPQVAMMVADAFEKIRINPGNFADGRKTFEVINYDDPAQFRAEQESIREVGFLHDFHVSAKMIPSCSLLCLFSLSRHGVSFGAAALPAPLHMSICWRKPVLHTLFCCGTLLYSGEVFLVLGLHRLLYSWRAAFRIAVADRVVACGPMQLFTPLVEKCKRLGRAMRIGTNHGSLSARILSYYGDTPRGMVSSCEPLLMKLHFHDCRGLSPWRHWIPHA